jgi:hypothetical protein
MSPHKNKNDFSIIKEEFNQNDLSGFNPDNIFRQLTMSDDLVIYTPRKENELVFKGNITP